MPSGRWAVLRFGREPAEIPSGCPFRVEVNGELKPTIMEFRHFDHADDWAGAPRLRLGAHSEYYSVDGYKLRDRQRQMTSIEVRMRVPPNG